jgi:hypothetical protein
MAIELDHLLIPVKGREAAARQLATLLGVPWGPSAFGPFSAVYVNDGLTLDFDEAEGSYPIQHYAFRVSPERFDAVLARLRAAGIAWRSTPHGPADGEVNPAFGGRMVYWDEPGGHHWELLTVSYARQAGPPGAHPAA